MYNIALYQAVMILIQRIELGDELFFLYYKMHRFGVPQLKI